MDRTYLAVRRQLQGMNCDGYEVGIRDASQGKIFHRQWDRAQVLQSVSFLKAVNVKGEDIYIRPSRSEGLLLVDDLGLGTLHRMDEEGCNPAAIIQTSPMNYQAWVRIQEGDLDQNIATQAAKLLAEHYGGDKNSADWRHYGRLAGFTNRKPEYHRPYVLAERCNGRVAPLGADILAEATRRLVERRENLQARDVPLVQLEPPSRPLKCDLDPIQYATNHYQTLKQRYGMDFDESRADCMVASDLLRMGWTANQARAILEQTSPDLSTRKQGHVGDYLERTMLAAHQRLNERGFQR